MKVHMAVLKTMKKFQEMTYEEQVENFDALDKFLTKYADVHTVTEGNYIFTPDRLYHHYEYYYTNVKGEKKILTVVISLYNGNTIAGVQFFNQ